MKRLTKLMAAVTFACSIPTFGAAASFNCAKASTANEIAICSDDELSTLDETLAAVYKQARSSVSDAKRLKGEQVNWIKSLGTCDGNVDCLISAYRNRILVLDYLDGQVAVTVDPLQDQFAQLNEREEILALRENALTTELRALNSAIEAFEEEKLAFEQSKIGSANTQEVDSQNKSVQKSTTQLCFNYDSLSESQMFVSSFAAASCAGYFAATQEASNPSMFAQLRDMAANVADVYEELHCSPRNISVGASGDVEEKFTNGYGVAMTNAAMVQNGAMQASEFKMRVDMCSQVVGHYLKQM